LVLLCVSPSNFSLSLFLSYSHPINTLCFCPSLSVDSRDLHDFSPENIARRLWLWHRWRNKHQEQGPEDSPHQNPTSNLLSFTITILLSILFLSFNCLQEK
jgi:hypothetical protein